MKMEDFIQRVADFNIDTIQASSDKYPENLKRLDVSGLSFDEKLKKYSNILKFE